MQRRASSTCGPTNAPVGHASRHARHVPQPAGDRFARLELDVDDQLAEQHPGAESRHDRERRFADEPEARRAAPSRARGAAPYPRRCGAARVRRRLLRRARRAPRAFASSRGGSRRPARSERPMPVSAGPSRPLRSGVCLGRVRERHGDDGLRVGEQRLGIGAVLRAGEVAELAVVAAREPGPEPRPPLR